MDVVRLYSNYMVEQEKYIVPYRTEQFKIVELRNAVIREVPQHFTLYGKTVSKGHDIFMYGGHVYYRHNVIQVSRITELELEESSNYYRLMYGIKSITVTCFGKHVGTFKLSYTTGNLQIIEAKMNCGYNTTMRKAVMRECYKFIKTNVDMETLTTRGILY